MYGRIGEQLLKAQVLQAKEALQLFEQKDERQLIDLYDEDAWLEKRLERFAPLRVVPAEEDAFLLGLSDGGVSRIAGEEDLSFADVLQQMFPGDGGGSGGQ